jgi:hypothetical protein
MYQPAVLMFFLVALLSRPAIFLEARYRGPFSRLDRPPRFFWRPVIEARSQGSSLSQTYGFYRACFLVARPNFLAPKRPHRQLRAGKKGGKT